MNYVPNYKSNFDFFFKVTLNTVTEYVYIWTCLKKARIIRTETWLKPDFWWLRWEFSFLICPIVKVSPWAILPWDGKGPPCQSSAAGGGSAKASHGQLISLENQFTGHVGRFANERIPLTDLLGCKAVSGQGMMWPWILRLGLVLVLAWAASISWALKQPEMAKLRVSFW